MASRLRIEPLTPHCGSEIAGVHVKDLTDDELARARSEAAQRCVVIFPAQFLSPQEQLGFARRLGEVLLPGHSPTLADAPGVMQFQNIFQYTGQSSGTDIWHTDTTHMPRPPSFTLLSCVQPAPLGGDTMWANQYLAYDTLSETMKAMISGRRLGFVIGPGYEQFRGPDDPVETFHPLVRVHIETWRKALFINHDLKSSHIEGLTDEESKPIKDYLYRHSQKPEHIYRHRWRAGDLAIWDNRCSMHYAIKDYDPKATRTMNRVMVMGEVPIGDRDADASGLEIRPAAE